MLRRHEAAVAVELERPQVAEGGDESTSLTKRGGSHPVVVAEIKLSEGGEFGKVVGQRSQPALPQLKHRERTELGDVAEQSAHVVGGAHYVQLSQAGQRFDG